MSDKKIGQVLILAGTLAILGLGLYAQIGTVEEREGVLEEQFIAPSKMYNNQVCLWFLVSENGEKKYYVFRNERSIREDLNPGDKIIMRWNWNINHPEGKIKGVWKKEMN